MAIDKAIDSGKLEAALEATADAIRAKTAGAADLPFDLAGETGFASAIAAITAGGGLPAGVDIATNTHTFASDVNYLNLSIDMSEAPTIFFIYTDDFGNDTTTNHVHWSIYVSGYGRGILCRSVLSDGTLGISAGTPTSTQLSMTKTSISLGIAGNNVNKKFVGGKTYKWFAVAI